MAESAGPSGRDAIDLDRYLARIGYRGTPRADLDTLCALTELHPAAIPFEAIDVLLGRPVDLSPAAIQAKLIDGGRGGYCFEHNSLLKRVLAALGFTVDGLLARVSWMRAPEEPPLPLTHMALRVTIGGERWLADVGFGSCVAGAPLRLDYLGAEQPARHETFRLSSTAGIASTRSRQSQRSTAITLRLTGSHRHIRNPGSAASCASR
jgi:N-hydroxyarylamine O-acetyltransferase